MTESQPKSVYITDEEALDFVERNYDPDAWDPKDDDVESHDDDFKPYSGALPTRTQIENVLELLGVTGPTKKKAKQQRTAVLVQMFEPTTYRKLKGKLKRREANIVARKQRRKNRLRSK